MLSDSIVALLNRQVNAELYASQVYLQMGAWCEKEGLPGAGAFFSSHVPEEISHRDKIVAYMYDCDAEVKLTAMDAPRTSYAGLIEVIEEGLAHEKSVTAMISEIASACMKEGDFTTFSFIQFFIDEQREEEALFRGILDQVNLSGFDGTPGIAMRHMNNYLQSLADIAAAPSAAGATPAQ